MKNHYLQNLTILLISFLLFNQCNNRIKPVSQTKLETKSVIHDPQDTFKYSIQPVKGNLQKVSTIKIQQYLANFLDTLNTTHYIKDKINQAQLLQELDSFYTLNNNRLFWSTQEHPLPNVQPLVGELLNASAHGLNSDDYDVSKLINFQDEVFRDPNQVNVFQLIQLDIRLSIAYITYGWHLRNGRYNPVKIEKIWYDTHPTESVAAILFNNNIQKAIDEVTPQIENYRQLVKALEKYKAIELNGGWTLLPEDTNLRIGDSSIVVPELKRHLTISRDLADSDLDEASTLFDERLESAVKLFQSRHGLTADGIVGKGTIQVLNVPISNRIAQIKLNMERIRWMANSLGDRYLYVNIPEYKLYAIEDGKIPLQMRVIVGKEDLATPILNDRMNYLVLSPTWTVPKKIIQEEMLPRIRRDSTYLSRNGYQLYSSWGANGQSVNLDSTQLKELEKDQIKIVQKPGPGNALGQVKFVLTNKRSIYLHDTPTDYLFNRNDRAFSHGCVRVERPDQLAEYLLKDKKWDHDKVREYMNMDEPVNVALKESIPVFIVYRTAWVDQNGLMNFRPDVYKADKIQLAALQNSNSNQSIAGLF